MAMPFPALSPPLDAFHAPGAASAPPSGGADSAAAPGLVAAGVSLVAGLLTPFTVSLGGEMPLGEGVLFAAAGWAVLIVALARVWPGPLWPSPLFLGLLLGQAVALGAYVLSDLYRGSAPPDLLRGWARMVFLAVDLAAVAYLVGCSARNFVLLLVGVQLGEVAKVLLQGALFGDVWKFGYALPVTVGVFLLAGRLGPLVAAAIGAALGLLHFVLDFRSLGLICLLVSALVAVQCFPRAARAWLAPLGLAAGLAVVAVAYAHTRTDREGKRSTRSDVERTAMVRAAAEAFADSPLIGHGSWFSRTEVMANFMVLREEGAREAGVGGFAGANEEEEGVTLHSQILVTLAEGGLFGAAFFLPYALGLLWALRELVVVRDWSSSSPLRAFVLSLAFFNLLLSPFSGAHRVHIALAAVLLVLIHHEARTAPGTTAGSRTPEVRA